MSTLLNSSKNLKVAAIVADYRTFMDRDDIVEATRCIVFANDIHSANDWNELDQVWQEYKINDLLK